MSTRAIDGGDNDLVITRVFDAPRAFVWKAWTERERLAHWWGPKGFELEVRRFELRPGGIFLYAMRSAGGQEMWGRFVYREVTPPERLVYVSSFSDPDGGMTRAPFGGDFTHWPLEILNTVTFTELGGKTKMVLHATPINASDEERATFAAVRPNVQGGYAGTFAQLDEYLMRAKP